MITSEDFSNSMVVKTSDEPGTGARPHLSVAIIARDEEQRLGACLRSAAFADEIIVADTGSQDGTARLAREHGARVVQVPFHGFGDAKNRATEEASGEWVLSLDADERITDALRLELLAALENPGKTVAFSIPRISLFLEKPMRHGGWGRDRVLRLFRRGKARFSDDQVHERLLVDGPTAPLKSPMLHDTTPTLGHYLTKMDRYSTLAARRIAKDPQRRVGVLPGLLHGLGNGLRKYFLLQGFRDGWRGCVLAAGTTYEKFLRYVKADLIRRGREELL